MQGVVVTSKGHAGVRTIPVPAYESNQVLVETKAIALNPVDWKRRDTMLPDGAGIGTDFAGVVCAVGEDVTDVKVGDRVAGAIGFKATGAREGAFSGTFYGGSPLAA